MSSRKNKPDKAQDKREYRVECFCYNNSYHLYNAGLEEAQAGIKVATRNINNLRYADDTILMAESEEDKEA